MAANCDVVYFVAQALVGSCFGCAGQRCLAGSVVVAVGEPERQKAVVEAFVKV
jgi:malonate-semialdehyde dehydrogenase (acetylating)/methylmalonate-semialdehyde dehydrogenase